MHKLEHTAAVSCETAAFSFPILLPFRIFGLMLIGIGGCSRAGKTTLARLVSERLVSTGRSVSVLHQDEYVIPEEDLPKIRNKPDWETPESIDWSQLTDAIRHARETSNVVIVEGLFCFYDEVLAAQMDHRLFVTIDRELFVYRKRQDLRWGSEPEPEWYIDHIWSAYEYYGIPADLAPYVVLDGSEFFDIDSVVNLILPT